MTMEAAECRQSFADALREAVQNAPRRVRFLDRMRVEIALGNGGLATDVESEVVDIGVQVGVFAPGDIDPATGLLTRNWADFLSLLIDRLPEILDFISGLVNIFSLFSRMRRR
jgi:hypothetical protein